MPEAGTVDSGATATGPASFSDAGVTWNEASPASTPTASPDAAQPADATAPPVTDLNADGTPPAAGEPPKERWESILANARQKAADEAVAPLAWAKQIDQGSLQEAIRIAQLSQRDPIAYMQEFIKDLQGHQTYGPQLKSLAAKALAQRTPPEAAPDLNPINLALEDGRTFSAFSAEQVQALLAQAVAKVKEEFQPVYQTHEALQAERAAAQQQAEIGRYVDTTHSDVKTWPGMDSVENQKAVAAKLATMQVSGDDPREVTLALNAAYRAVVLPQLSGQAETKLLDSLKTKAAASSSVNPGSAGASTPRAYKSFADLPKNAW